MGLLDLFFVAMMPVVKMLLISALGLYLAVDCVDVLSSAAPHHLNNVVFYVFLPSLVVVCMADSITMSSIMSLWFMPVNIFLTFIIGSALGGLLVKVTRTPKHLHGLVISCCAAGSLGNLPLIIIPALCQEKMSPFEDSSTCSSKGEAYVSLSVTLAVLFIWTYVYMIIQAYGNGTKSDPDMIDKNSGTITVDCSDITSSEISSDSLTKALLSKGLTEDKLKVAIFKKM